MYDQDSFFTLGVLGQLGLLAISVSMLIITTWAVMRIRAIWFTKLVIALIGFYLFVWLSPQIYYTYYLFIFDGLPFQNVIRRPPTPGAIFHLMTFTSHHCLSAHGLGILSWGLIIAGQLPDLLRKCRNAAN